MCCHRNIIFIIDWVHISFFFHQFNRLYFWPWVGYEIWNNKGYLRWFALPSWEMPYCSSRPETWKHIDGCYYGTKNCRFWSVKDLWWQAIPNHHCESSRNTVSYTFFLLHLIILLAVPQIFKSCCSGYMAPEYLIRGVVSNKADIFSLGVILLEIITGDRDYPYFHHDRSQRDATTFQQFTEKVRWIN